MKVAVAQKQKTKCQDERHVMTKVLMSGVQVTKLRFVFCKVLMARNWQVLGMTTVLGSPLPNGRKIVKARRQPH